jgi:hypothetical protein
MQESADLASEMDGSSDDEAHRHILTKSITTLPKANTVSWDSQKLGAVSRRSYTEDHDIYDSRGDEETERRMSERADDNRRFYKRQLAGYADDDDDEDDHIYHKYEDAGDNFSYQKERVVRQGFIIINRDGSSSSSKLGRVASMEVKSESQGMSTVCDRRSSMDNGHFREMTRGRDDCDSSQNCRYIGSDMLGRDDLCRLRSRRLGLILEKVGDRFVVDTYNYEANRQWHRENQTWTDRTEYMYASRQLHDTSSGEIISDLAPSNTPCQTDYMSTKSASASNYRHRASQQSDRHHLPPSKEMKHVPQKQNGGSKGPWKALARSKSFNGIKKSVSKLKLDGMYAWMVNEEQPFNYVFSVGKENLKISQQTGDFGKQAMFNRHRGIRLLPIT